jgi:hypothetical protein
MHHQLLAVKQRTFYKHKGAATTNMYAEHFIYENHSSRSEARN